METGMDLNLNSLVFRLDDEWNHHQNMQLERHKEES